MPHEHLCVEEENPLFSWGLAGSIENFPELLESIRLQICDASYSVWPTSPSACYGYLTKPSGARAWYSDPRFTARHIFARAPGPMPRV